MSPKAMTIMKVGLLKALCPSETFKNDAVLTILCSVAGFSDLAPSRSVKTLNPQKRKLGFRLGNRRCRRRLLRVAIWLREEGYLPPNSSKMWRLISLSPASILTLLSPFIKKGFSFYSLFIWASPSSLNLRSPELLA